VSHFYLTMSVISHSAACHHQMEDTQRKNSHSSWQKIICKPVPRFVPPHRSVRRKPVCPEH
jgi:hypothetical protein